MHTAAVSGSRPEQGRVDVSGSVCRQIFRGQCQGVREDARRGGTEARRYGGRRRLYVWVDGPRRGGPKDGEVRQSARLRSAPIIDRQLRLVRAGEESVHT